MEYFIDAFKQYAEFSGRATRKQYWMFILIYMVIYLSLSVIDVFLGTLVLALIFSLVLAAPTISITARRLHDTGRSGWWQLLSIIPLLGTIILIVFLVQDSQDANEYGARPAIH